MLSVKTKRFKDHLALSLDDLVSETSFYRQLEAKLVLSFVREPVQAHYAAKFGRPSIDPAVFFKL